MGHLMFDLIKTKKKMKTHIMLVVMPSNTYITTLLFPSLYSNSHDSSAPNSGVQCALLGWKEEVGEVVGGEETIGAALG